jgi:hypothetical protein
MKYYLYAEKWQASTRLTDVDVDDCLLEYCAVQSGKSLPTFQRYLLPPSSGRWLIALMMEAANTSETSVNLYQTTRRNIPEDSHLQISETSTQRIGPSSRVRMLMWTFGFSPVVIEKKLNRLMSFVDVLNESCIHISHTHTAYTSTHRTQIGPVWA